jgi:DNA-binding Lrp family transcriptional regulator
MPTKGMSKNKIKISLQDTIDGSEDEGDINSKNSKPTSKLSLSDKEILKVLLSPENGSKRSSSLLASKLGIPQTTIQRRKKRLEKEFLTSTYTLDLEKFGWRHVDLLISTEMERQIF